MFLAIIFSKKMTQADEKDTRYKEEMKKKERGMSPTLNVFTTE